MRKVEKILCFGEVLWDNLPTGALPGGAPMNVALHLKRFGIRSKVASSIGNDSLGLRLKEFLEKSGLDTQFIQTSNNLPTSEVIVKLNEQNNPSFEICEPVAWDQILLIDDLVNETNHSDAIVFGSLASRNDITRNTLLKLLESDIVKIMDVNLRKPYDKKEIIEPLIQKADIIKLNDDELIRIGNWYGLTGTLVEVAFELYNKFKAKLLLITKGENGASLIYENKIYDQTGFKVSVVDTVGAGDAFLAGFLSAFYKGKDLNLALKEACYIGAFVASKQGATPEYDGNMLIQLAELKAI